MAAALDEYTDNPSDSTQAAGAIQALGRIVSEQVPVVPIMYGVAWAEFSTRHASGWPNGQDNYEPATPAAPFAEYTVLQLGPPSSLTPPVDAPSGLQCARGPLRVLGEGPI